jgi:hypothetical protein
MARCGRGRAVSGWDWPEASHEPRLRMICHSRFARDLASPKWGGFGIATGVRDLGLSDGTGESFLRRAPHPAGSLRRRPPRFMWT